jgi:nucleoid-associated protein YgaU
MEELFFDYTAKEKRQIRRMRSAAQRSSRSNIFAPDRRTVLILLVAVIVFFFTAFFLAKSIHANANQLKTGTKGFVSYEIKSGDTLWDIAGKYISEDYPSIPELVKAIEKTNNIRNGKIYAGNYIIIPVSIQSKSQAD